MSTAAQIRMDEKVKEFDAQCVQDLEDAGFYEVMNKLMTVCSALKDKGFSFSTKVEHSNFISVKVTKRGPDWKFHRFV